MCNWFSPTNLSLSFETQGMGAFGAEDIERIVERDESGNVKSLRLPERFVLTANHQASRSTMVNLVKDVDFHVQVYADWWYAWCLLYFVGPRGVHRQVYITLKKSLKWIPIIGWGMQFFNFIFLARSWASDRLQLAHDLSVLGKEAESEDVPFAFILYPEGTLVSKDTRPISRKFADKMGIVSSNAFNLVNGVSHLDLRMT
jgi:lysocardiolipin and lysophospholipid acyltransferase